MTQASETTDIAPFVAATPWLRELWPEALARLSPDEWYPLPDADVERQRTELEDALQANIMAYRREAQGLADALAALVEPADLTDHQLALLRAVEDTTRDCVFVAFARPLRPRKLPPRRLTRRRAKR